MAGYKISSKRNFFKNPPWNIDEALAAAQTRKQRLTI